MAEIVYPPIISIVKTLWRYLGLRFDFDGEENVPRTGGAILAINHVSYLDFAIAGTAALPAKRFVRFMAKKEIFDNKLLGPLMRGMHHINVDRSQGADSYVAALKALESGEIIGVFPEGTTSLSYEIKTLKTGALRLAAGAGVPLIPTIVWGGQRIFTKGVKPNFKRAKTPITVRFGKAIYFPPDADIVAAELHLRQVLIQMLHEIQENYPDSHVGQRWAPLRLGGTAPAPLN